MVHLLTLESLQHKYGWGPIKSLLCPIYFFWFGGILGSASRVELPVSLSNHVGFTPRLLYSSTHHSPDSFTHLKTGWAHDTLLQWSYENWYYHLDISRWPTCCAPYNPPTIGQSSAPQTYQSFLGTHQWLRSVCCPWRSSRFSHSSVSHYRRFHFATWCHLGLLGQKMSSQMCSVSEEELIQTLLQACHIHTHI